MNRRDFMTLLAGSCLAGAGLPARAASAYPDRPIRVIVPFTAGGGTDVVARAIAAGMSTSMSASFVVENKPGASTMIGSNYVAKEAPNGYTLLVASGPHMTNPWLMKNLPYDTQKAFAPISLMVKSPFILVASPSSQLNSLDDVIKRAKTKSLTFASTGTGTNDHLSMELLAIQQGLKMTHVPYKGTGPALADLMGGQVDLMFANVIAVVQLVKSGKLRALAASTSHRSATLPDVGTVTELTGQAFDVSAWAGMLAPAGTDAAIVERLSAEVGKALQMPNVRETLLINGAEPVGSTPAQFQDFITSEMDTWGKIIKKLDIQPS